MLQFNFITYKLSASSETSVRFYQNRRIISPKTLFQIKVNIFLFFFTSLDVAGKTGFLAVHNHF